MPFPTGLNHFAMSVPEGTLTDEFRSDVMDFYGTLLGWRELEDLRLPDRMTLGVGRHTYVNIRERAEPMVCHGYEHFGVVLESADAVERLWSALDNADRDVELEPLGSGTDGYRAFRFRHLLPFAVEVMYFP